ncbi:MAG: hypothetical protein II947_07710 [Bacteroidaceae bacterium]|nr:hypothetical protein [Bacteroidaceae bacterium]
MTQSYFQDIENIITIKLNTAKESIFVAVAWFTNQRLFDCLVNACHRNVNVRVLILNDILNRNEFGLDFGILVNAGAEVRFANTSNNATMHNKFCIIDDKVITGSYNWTYHANINAENVVLIDEPTITNNYRQQFDFLFNVGEPIKIPYEHIEWTNIKEGDFSELRRNILKDVIAKNEVDKYLIQEKLINLNRAYKIGNDEELLKASQLPTKQKVRTIVDVLTSNSQNFAFELWKENTPGKPFNKTVGHTHIGKWFYVFHSPEKDKYNRDYIKGELKANDRYCLWIEGIKLDIYDKEFIDTIKNFLGSKPITYDNNECIPESVIRINKAQMFFYKFSSPLYNKSQNRTWRNGMPRTIPAINVFGIVKEVIDDKIVFYEGWDPNERGKKIAEKFFEK